MCRPWKGSPSRARAGPHRPIHPSVDAGELCGERATRVLATTDRDAVLKLGANCCIYTPRATGSASTRAGLTEDELVEDVVALLESGTNVVTTCSDLFARGVRLSEENRSRVLQACGKGNASVWPSGSDPGFITETVPMALLSVQRRVDSIEIEEFGDLSRRPSPHMVMDQMRFGKPLSEFDPDPAQEWIIIHGRSGGVDRIRFIQYGFVGRDVEPDWGLQPTGWRIRIRGDAPFDVSMPFPVPLEELGSFVPWLRLPAGDEDTRQRAVPGSGTRSAVSAGTRPKGLTGSAEKAAEGLDWWLRRPRSGIRGHSWDGSPSQSCSRCLSARRWHLRPSP